MMADGNESRRKGKTSMECVYAVAALILVLMILSAVGGPRG